VSGTDGVVRILEADSGKVLLSHNQYLIEVERRDPMFPVLVALFRNSALFSSDGKAVASPYGEGTMELWNSASGKTIRRFKAPEKRPSEKEEGQLVISPLPLAFSPDGRLLAVMAEGPDFLFNAETGKPGPSIHFAMSEKKTRFIAKPFALAIPAPAFTPKGDGLAIAGDQETTLWDLKTGKPIRTFEGHQGNITAICLSPNGQIIASCEGDWVVRPTFHPLKDNTIRLWELATGRPLLTIKGHADNVRSVVFCPDGRSFLSAGEDKTVRLWETCSGKELFRWNFDESHHDAEVRVSPDVDEWNPANMVTQLAISPDGKKVAALVFPGSVTLFPIDPPQPNKPRPTVDAKAFERLWSDLAGQDAEQAYRAVRSLSEAGEDVPARIGRRLKPADSLARWIADLDNDDFGRREAASKQLTAFGAQAEPALRKALNETQSAEVRSRVRPLLKAVGEWVVTDPDTLRSLRAIWVLERIGTPEARAVLEDLAKGAPEARQTQEAKAALDFLDTRAAAGKP
jgi:WD40 repeat protein